jgi:hypothetical protein
MRAERLSLVCVCMFTLFAGVIFVPAGVMGQAGHVSLNGTVSETVVLSVLPSFSAGKVEAEAVRSGNSLRLTLTSGDDEAPIIRVPLLVRSNTGFRISAVFESDSTTLAQLSVIDVHPTGKLASSRAVNLINLTPRFDLRDLDKVSRTAQVSVSQPALVLSGPRISFGGTLESPNNALQLTLLIRLQPQPARTWVAHLTFVATPESLVQ